MATPDRSQHCRHCARRLTPAELDDPAGDIVDMTPRGLVSRHLCGDCTDLAVFGESCPACQLPTTRGGCPDSRP